MYTFKLKRSQSPVHRSGAATIVLSEYSLDADKDHCITHSCKSHEELLGEIRRLKQELDAIASQAAEVFRG
jgi:hypothetical protein